MITSEEKFKGLIESAPDAMVIVDGEGKIRIVNSQTEKLFGYRREELLGQSVEMLIPERFRGTHSIYRTGYFLDPKTRPMDEGLELYGLHKDRGEFPVDISLSPLHTEEGVLVTAAIRDITEQKRAQAALKESEERWRAVFENSTVGIALTELNGRFVATNRAYQGMLGYSGDELRKVTLLDITHEEDQGPSWALVTRLLNGWLSQCEMEKRCRRKDGDFIWVHLTVSLIRDRQEQPQFIIAIVADITQRKEAEAALAESQRRLQAGHDRMRSLSRRLVEAQEVERRHIARELHDQVGQNLTALNINLSILRGQLSSESDSAAAVVSRLDDSLKLVEETVVSIRDVMTELRPAVLDDYGLFSALRWYGEQFSGRTGIAAQVEGVELTPRLPAAVETALFRIAQEALTNVAKHAQAKQVTLTLEALDELARLIIADDGIGFFPTDPYRSGEHRGLGLDSLRERAEAAGGRLAVESAPGQGTRVIVEVPR